MRIAVKPVAESVVGLGSILDRNKVMQKDLATELGVAPETVSRWCTGEITPGGRTVLRIVGFLRRLEPRLRAEDLFAEDGHAIVD